MSVAQNRGITLWLFVMVCGIVMVAGAALGKAIPRDEYLHYVPLKYPTLVEQTTSNGEFHLFGDRGAPGYRDVAPVDGIDDARQELLQTLGARFGPIMVLNSTNLPMDFRRFMDQSQSSNLHVDTWSLLGSPKELVRSDMVNLNTLVEEPCDSTSAEARRYDPSGDCLLMDLLDRFDPRDPDFEALNPRSRAPDAGQFQVFFFDWPGEGPESWKKEFENGFSQVLPQKYREFLKVYMHPFIREVTSPRQGVLGYQFVLQYYFFYPTNDGGNNHEGDWEHINVMISPQGSVTSLLTADQVGGILGQGAGFGEDAGDPLVIKAIDYYFHEQVYRMDYSSPNAYLEVEAWKQEMRAKVPERNGEQTLWKWRRYAAWWDQEETVVNTHPICFIGADNKGFDQVLTSPGGKNRDSHGTYPYPGLFKDIGPGGATEQINGQLDSRDWYAEHKGDITGNDQTRFGRGDVVPYTTSDRVEVWPDWERVIEPVMTDPVARRDWFWMMLPVRWGYPATESPFAGIIPHAETGNLAPMGPMFQPHWNRSGSEGGSNSYEPHMFETLFPLGLQDSFVNSWGFLNLTLPVLASMPPIDFIWRLVAYPFRKILQHNDPVFFPSENIPSRFVGLNVGVSKLRFNDEIGILLFNGDPGIELLGRIWAVAPDGLASGELNKTDPVEWWWQVNFYLGKGFATQNTLLNSRSPLGMTITTTDGNLLVVDSEFHLWEYAGSFRFDIFRGGFKPYVKVGYGWTWYRVQDMTFNGELLDNHTGEWINQPSFNSFSDMMPNSWNAGAGLEVNIVSSLAPFPSGVDVSLVLEASHTQNNMGVESWVLLLQEQDLRHESIKSIRLKRWNFNLGLTLGF